MNEFKESLLQQKQKIEEKLRAIADKEREEEERKKKEKQVSDGLFTPLKWATVKEDIFWCSGDERIESYGYGTARDFLRGPSFDRGDSLVLIKNSSHELIWVPEKEDGDYSDSEDDTHIPDEEIYDMLENIQVKINQ